MPVKLRSIPPRTMAHVRPVARRNAPASRVSSWHPHVVPHASRTPAGEPLAYLRSHCQSRIDDLTDEIAQWLPEMGEQALLLIYEERARWAELIYQEGHADER